MGKYFWDNDPNDKKDDDTQDIQEIENQNNQLREMLAKARVSIDQLDHLYAQYFSGYEKRPPNNQRSKLEQLMKTAEKHPKPTPSLKFQYNTIYSRYITYRDRWDKKCKEMESGKPRGRL